MSNEVKMLNSVQRQMYPQDWDGNIYKLSGNGDCG